MNKHNSQKDVDDFRDYCQNLDRGKINDDKGNAFPAYMTVTGSQVRFGVESFHVFKSVFATAFRTEKLGLIPN